MLTEPVNASSASQVPAVVTWNVGLHHHVGPHRFFVSLGRALAAVGFTSLRFDISGLGDSEVSRDDTRREFERAISDVREAMAALTRQRGFDRFVPIGFCSSVDAAHSLAATSREVAGVVYLEGYGFGTRGYYLRYPLRLLNRNRWERLLRTKYPKLFGEHTFPNDPSYEREQVYVRDYPSREKLRADVFTMLERGARLLLVYAGGDTTYAYRDQFFEMIRSPETAPRVELEFYADMDHTFFLEEDRQKVIRRVVRFMQNSFGPRL
ncbi:MAG TPA: alpha/beta fold hydrolase [Polyangiaceae bacterium]